MIDEPIPAFMWKICRIGCDILYTKILRKNVEQGGKLIEVIYICYIRHTWSV